MYSLQVNLPTKKGHYKHIQHIKICADDLEQGLANVLSIHISQETIGLLMLIDFRTPFNHIVSNHQDIRYQFVAAARTLAV